MSEASVIRLEHVTKRYDETKAVDDVSFDVLAGEVCVLIGPSGSGKTTTLRMINRLLEPTSGRIFVDGRDTGTVDPVELRRGIGYAIQSLGLFPHLTVAQNIAVVPGLVGWPRDRTRRRVDELLELVGLDPEVYRDKHPRQLSGGQAQRVGVARALAADPPVLLMDEPFGAVDPFTRVRLQAEFLRIQRDLRKTVVFVTHDLDEAIRLANRVLVMRDGRVVQYDTPDEILARPVDDFVRDFVGADRALKRLSRIEAGSAMSPVKDVVSLRASLEEAHRRMGPRRTLWVVDEAGVLLGWAPPAALARAKSVQDALVRVEWRDVSIASDMTLRDALSKMLALDFRNLPVTDPQGRLLGEVSLETFEQVSGTEQTE
jgi:osmoprotectant transport system ATP-binding protein